MHKSAVPTLPSSEGLSALKPGVLAGWPSAGGEPVDSSASFL